jgi:hypothetical protein
MKEHLQEYLKFFPTPKNILLGTKKEAQLQQYPIFFHF